MAGTSSINGLISGLRTDEIVTKMMELAKRPQTKLQTDKTDAQLRLSTWQNLNVRIMALKSKVDSLAVSNAFENCQANSSDLSVLQATAGVGASPGTYFLKVINRAQGHQVAGAASGESATPFTSAGAVIGTGNVSFSFDNDHTKDFTVKIDTANNTLTGLRDSINRENKGIQASIINTGSTSSPAYQLLLTCSETGEISQFTVDADESIGIDFSGVIQKGTDAEIQFGGGGDGSNPITVKKSSNTITDLIAGVTLNIVNHAPDKTIKLEVVRGTSVIKNSIQEFVAQYNDLADAISEQFAYDPATNITQPLMGSWDLQQVQMTLNSLIGSVVTGVEKQFSALATLGITLDSSGHLQIDEAALNKALESNLQDVSRLFASDLRSDSSHISMLSSSAETQPASLNGWEVNITQAARQAQVTAAGAFASSLNADETLTIYTNSSSSANIALKQRWSLDRVISEINKYADKTQATAIATRADGSVSADPNENVYLSIRSVRYGGDADVNVYSSTDINVGNTTGFGNVVVTSQEPGAGSGLRALDVVGTINGEACTGKGQILTAEPNNPKSSIKGLTLLITSSSAMVSKVYFTKGIATSLRDSLVDMTSSNGTVTKAQDALTETMSDIDKNIADIAERLRIQEDKLYTQFNAMEAQLARLQQQGQYLTQQIAAMNNTYSK
ncbi:MAG: flagellar filament capping protein FliD [Armatimonadetes bacterium]|nr:flagellar filament capping protein FliD [Armatimonadota bacterium]